MTGLLFLLAFLGSVPGSALGTHRDLMPHADFPLNSGLPLGSPIAALMIVPRARILASRSAGG